MMRWNQMPNYGVGINCKDCPDRHRACQDTCEKMLKAKAEYKELLKVERKKDAIMDYILDTAKKAKIKRMKRSRFR